MQLAWLRLLGMPLVVLVLLLLSGMVMAREAVSVTVRLDPVGGSGVSGTAILSAVGGGTSVALDIKGLVPGAAAGATMHANTCAMPSASFAALPNLKADETGRATATGSVLYRGTENVALATVADGEHVIAIGAEQVVACGVIPTLGTALIPPTLPVTGGVAPSLIAVGAGVLGLCTLSAGLLLWRRGRPVRRF